MSSHELLKSITYLLSYLNGSVENLCNSEFLVVCK